FARAVRRRFQETDARIGIVDDGGERLVDFMGDGGGQFTHGRQSCHMSEFGLRFMECMLCTIEVFNIRLEFSCGLAEFFFMPFLCAGDREDENGGQRKNDQTRYLPWFYCQRMDGSQEVVVDRR